MRRLDKAFGNFFRRIKAKAQKPGYPRFKARGRFDSIEFPAYGDGIRLTGNRLRVQHVGMLRVKLHRPVQGKVKTAALKLQGTSGISCSCAISATRQSLSAWLHRLVLTSG